MERITTNKDDVSALMDQCKDMTPGNYLPFVEECIQKCANNEDFRLYSVIAPFVALLHMEKRLGFVLKPTEVGELAASISRLLVYPWDNVGVGVISYQSMLNPKNEAYFKTIPWHVFNKMQEVAQGFIEAVESPEVEDMQLWKDVIAGVAPFGYSVGPKPEMKVELAEEVKEPEVNPDTKIIPFDKINNP